MTTPAVFLRGSVWCSDLRGRGGKRRHSLGVREGASEFEVGMALQRTLDVLRLQAGADTPELPGLAAPDLAFADLVGRYLDGRDYDTVAGRHYVAEYCAGIRARLGRLSVRALVAPSGETVLRKWRDEMWAKGLANKTVNNYLSQTLAIMRWGRTGGRRFFPGDLPELPSAIRPGQLLRVPVFDFVAEQDFRTFRVGAFEEWRKLNRFGVRTEAVIAQRQLYLSWAFYSGLHNEDLDHVVPEWFSTDTGRWWRHNTKSARAIPVEPFDMPEQLVLDCEAEMRRLGRRWNEGEAICGGRWRAPSDALVRASRRTGLRSAKGKPFSFRLARRSTVRELTIRGWRIHEISAYLGHVDDSMVRQVYQHCSELGLVSPVRLPWKLGTGPGGRPTGTATVLQFRTG